MDKHIQLTARDAVNTIRIQQVQALYDRYAGMLFGFILEIVKNKEKAEQCLASVFKELPGHLDDLKNSNLSEFCFLQKLTRKKTGGYSDEQADKATASALSGHLAQLSDEHRKVFYGLHYRCKTTATLAAELNKTEAEIRLLLKEAFTTIRKEKQV